MSYRFWSKLRIIKHRLFGESQYSGFIKDNVLDTADSANMIKSAILLDKPLMVARLGTTELEYMVEFQSRNHGYFSKRYSYVSGASKSFEWDDEGLNNGLRHSGIFPKSPEIMNRFCELMFDDLKEVDFLGSWQMREALIDSFIHARKVPLKALEPYYHLDNPWSAALEGKRLLVVHPFAKSIEQQYAKRELLFPGSNVLPLFDLKVIKSVQSIYGIDSGFTNWFDALEHMKKQVNETEFDIAIIGCGAYGFPLAAHVKRLGKKAIHLGGATQVLFGIRGKRWDEHPVISKLVNEHWARPLEEETPDDSANIVYGSYW